MDIQCPKALKSEQKRELDFGFKSAIDDTTRGLCSARLVSKSLVLLKKARCGIFHIYSFLQSLCLKYSTKGFFKIRFEYKFHQTYMCTSFHILTYTLEMFIVYKVLIYSLVVVT